MVPGAAGREIQERNQWEAAQLRSEAVMGIAENPMRRRIEEAADLIGLRYIVNCIPDGARRMAGCVAGDVVLAHRAGCRLTHRINPFLDLAQLVAVQAVDDVVGVSVLADLAQVMDRVQCILVSPGVPRAQAERIGFRHAATVRAALAMAFARHGTDARVAILRRGGQVLPHVSGEARDA